MNRRIPSFLRGNPLESHTFAPFTYPCLDAEQARMVAGHLASLAEVSGRRYRLWYEGDVVKFEWRNR